MKKSGGSSFKFSLGRQRKPRRSSQTHNGDPGFTPPELRPKPNPLLNPMPNPSLADRRAQRNRSKSKETSSKGFLGFLPKFGKKRPTKVALRPASKMAQVVEFPRKPQRPSLEELRSKRREREPRRHALFSPPDNPIRLPRPRNHSQAALLYVIRLLILGVGLAVISGTILSIWDPTTRLTAGTNSSNAAIDTAAVVKEDPNPLPLGQEFGPLKSQIQTLITQNAKLSPSVMLVDLDSHAYVDFGATEVVPAASTIKLPILIAFFQDVDQGKIQLDQPIVMRKDLIATEAGGMQYQPVGSKFAAIKTAVDMITVSDNTATNMLIDLLGGPDALNQRFQSWGLTGTMVRNALPDVKGTNTTTAKDMGMMLSLLSRGKLMSIKSRDRVLDIMRRVENDSLLPKGLGEGATISHKTGTIGTMLADVGLVDTATGRRYVAAVLVKRPRNDQGAYLLIQQISKLSYRAFNQQTTSVTAPPIGKNVPKDESLGRSRIAQP
jgi:beta-lactamase class A